MTWTPRTARRGPGTARGGRIKETNNPKIAQMIVEQLVTVMTAFLTRVSENLRNIAMGDNCSMRKNDNREQVVRLEGVRKEGSYKTFTYCNPVNFYETEGIVGIL